MKTVRLDLASQLLLLFLASLRYPQKTSTIASSPHQAIRSVSEKGLQGMATKAADQPQHAVNEYQDCILCRLTGTVVMSMLSLGAFKEAWRLHREAGTGNRMSSASAQAQTAEVMKGAAATVSRLVKAMAVFPPSAGSDTPAAASRRAPLSPAPGPSSPGGSAAAAPSLKRPVGHPTGRVTFLALAGVGFASAAIWRAVMPANKPIQPVTTRVANVDKQQQSFAA